MARKMSYNRMMDYFDHLQEALYTFPVEKFREQLNQLVKKGFPVDFCPKNTIYGTLLEDSFERNHADGTSASFALLEAGADVNRITHNGNTMLMLAILKKANVDLIAKVLALTNDIDHQNKYGRTAFGYLCRHYIALSYNNYPKPLEYQKELIRLVPKFIAAGADTKLDDFWRKTEHYLDCEKGAYTKLNALVEVCLEKRDNMTHKLDSGTYDYEI